MREAVLIRRGGRTFRKDSVDAEKLKINHWGSQKKMMTTTGNVFLTLHAEDRNRNRKKTTRKTNTPTPPHGDAKMWMVGKEDGEGREGKGRKGGEGREGKTIPK